ncbi:MAG: SDR family NAD(P)-dependent oxidoreductase [Oleibacter sp.]|nr:SDR family NAD(P)-dependent oxidoreductase [Thalassolituus sp.]
MTDLINNVVITGAGSGLGRAFALQFAHMGYDICLSDINEEGLQQTLTLITEAGAQQGLKIDIWTFNLDVRNPSQWQDLLAAVVARWGCVGTVINNAGVAHADRMGDGQWQDWQWVLDINLKGVMLGCHTFTPLMKQQGHGRLLNIASLAGIMNPPTMSAYNVSKAGVIALSDTLHFELKPYGIDVTVLCPNFFKTNLNDSMRSSDANLKKSSKRLIEDKPSMSVDDIAATAIKALFQGKRLCVPDTMGRFAAFAKTYLPFIVRRKIRVISQGMRQRELKQKQLAQSDQ